MPFIEKLNEGHYLLYTIEIKLSRLVKSPFFNLVIRDPTGI